MNGPIIEKSDETIYGKKVEDQPETRFIDKPQDRHQYMGDGENQHYIIKKKVDK
jgi:hypothetical protein